MSDGVVQTFLFRAPYHMEPHSSEENGLNWNDGFIPYDQVFTVLSEAVAIYIICTRWGMTSANYSTVFWADPYTITRPSRAPIRRELKSEVHCYLTCHSYPHIRCATRNAWALHCWRKYNFKTKSYIKCPPKHTRHTAQFSSGVPKPNTVA